MDQKCPICNAVMEYEEDVMEGYVVCEEYYTCPKGHYRYEYTYGFGREFVGRSVYWTVCYKEFTNMNWSMKLELRWNRFRCRWHIRLIRRFGE